MLEVAWIRFRMTLKMNAAIWTAATPRTPSPPSKEPHRACDLDLCPHTSAGLERFDSTWIDDRKHLPLSIDQKIIVLATKVGDGTHDET